jgi:hypothetical protein
MNHGDHRDHGERSEKTVRKRETSLDAPCLLAPSPDLVPCSAFGPLVLTFSALSVSSVVRTLLLPGSTLQSVVDALSGYDLVEARKNCSELPRFFADLLPAKGSGKLTRSVSEGCNNCPAVRKRDRRWRFALVFGVARGIAVGPNLLQLSMDDPTSEGPGNGIAPTV